MSTVNNMQIQDDEGNVFHPETSIEQIVGENGTQVFPGGKPGNMESSDMTTAFTESKMRENIKSGEKHGVLFGKIQKFFTDLKTVAFSGKYGDLSERPTLGGAAGYKVADNDTTNSSEFLPTARVTYEHGQEIDALSRDLTPTSVEIILKSNNGKVVANESVLIAGVILVSATIVFDETVGLHVNEPACSLELNQNPITFHKDVFLYTDQGMISGQQRSAILKCTADSDIFKIYSGEIDNRYYYFLHGVIVL